MLYTDNIGLKKPAYSEPADIADINENFDIIDREFGNRYLKSETYSVEQANNAIAQAIEALPNGLVYRGAVNYYKDLPTDSNELGDTYSVKYQGETGTTADGNEYAWGEYDGALQWIKLGVNAYTKDEIDEQNQEIKSDILKAENDIAINRATLGIQVKNLFDFDTWKVKALTAVTRGTAEEVENGFKLTATDTDCFTGNSGSSTGYKIPVRPNTKYKITWKKDLPNYGAVYIFKNGLTNNNQNSGDPFVFTTDSDTTFITLRFGVSRSGESITYYNIMVVPADVSTAEYAPFTTLDLQSQINTLIERITALETAQATTE